MKRQTAIQAATPNDIQVSPAVSQAVEPASAAGAPEVWSYVPSMDAWEGPSHYTLTFDAPGLDADTISLNLQNNTLSLHGQVNQRYPEGAKFLRQEYGVGDFDRSVPLGRIADFIDAEKITAEYECGVLKVNLPKTQRAQSHKIKVKSA